MKRDNQSFNDDVYFVYVYLYLKILFYNNVGEDKEKKKVQS